MSEPMLPTQLTAGVEAPRGGGSNPASSPQQPTLAIRTHKAGERVTVVVSGEIDMISAGELQAALCDALDRSGHGIDLDLSAVDFCDCSGLTVLLRMRRRARSVAKDLTFHVASAAMRRLLVATGTLSLFVSTAGNDEIAAATDPRGLRAENMHLKRAMQTRSVIDIARGVLMATFNMSAEDAWKVLVEVSQNTNTKLHEVARDLVNAVNSDHLLGPYRQQVAATVTKIQSAPAAPRQH